MCEFGSYVIVNDILANVETCEVVDGIKSCMLGKLKSAGLNNEGIISFIHKTNGENIDKFKKLFFYQFN
jgi:hypothetical protein